LLVIFFAAPVFFVFLRPAPDRSVDYFQEWSSVRNLFSGLPIYADLKITTPLYLRLSDYDPAATTVEINAHPPTAVLLAVPFGLLDYSDAVLAWNLVSLGLLGASLYLVSRELRIRLPFRWILPALAAMSVCGPLLMQVLQGQLNLVILFLLTLAWVADRANRPFLAGCFVGVATAVKIFPAFLFLYFIITRRWKAILGGALTLLALSGLTAAVLGFDAYRDYILEAIPRVSKFRGSWNNASLVGFWTRLLEPGVDDGTQPRFPGGGLAFVAIVASCLLVTASIVRVTREARVQEDRDRAFGLAVIGMLLISPVTWEHSLLLLLLPIATIGASLPERRVFRGAFALILVAFWIVPSPVHYFFLGRVSPPHGAPAAPLLSLTVLSYQFYALLGLFVLGVHLARRGTKKGSKSLARRDLHASA
jgi:hypothetical protein